MNAIVLWKFCTSDSCNLVYTLICLSTGDLFPVCCVCVRFTVCLCAYLFIYLWLIPVCCVWCRTDLRLNQPRYATLPNIMKAKSKPIKKFKLEDLKVDIKSDLEIVEVTEPPKRKAGVIVSSVDELIDKLKNEAHVIWILTKV